ncbi:alkyl hydroperoxide reductase subunit F [Amphibacillus sp. Q70]|uniref:alkyl hydroperoxide reductase subunit F n=1 Tax=Amphibacillus sp. Q70 TaxID=3453416 RepID=UPI003F8382AC
MALENKLKSQLAYYLESLESDIVFKADLNDDEDSKEVKAFLEEITEMSSKLSIEAETLSRTPSFALAQPGQEARIEFAGLPLDHEFISFILALQQVAGLTPKVDEDVAKCIEKIDKKIHFETYVSLTCHNCPDIVQSLNMMSVLNPNISHTMIESRMFQEEREAKNVLAVPTIFLDGEEVASGRKTIEQLVELAMDSTSIEQFLNKEVFDVLVVGGGPAGNSATIYSVRKGLNTGMLVDTYGGKVMDIPGIENMIGIPYTEGTHLMGEVEQHVNQYYVDIMKNQRAKSIRKKDLIEVELENGAVLKAKSVILSVGVTWRKLNIPGEEDFYTKGVVNCPHCDGPLFIGKDVAVVGGENPAIEGAIDLAGKAKHVYILELSSELKADKILQDRVNRLSNITVIKNAVTKEITGTDRVNGMTYVDCKTNAEHHIALDGVFVQIGLVPNTAWLRDSKVELNENGEIVVDNHGMTSLAGVFAAGDCTNSAYKQIIISMGSGATAALGAFDYLIRH